MSTFFLEVVMLWLFFSPVSLVLSCQRQKEVTPTQVLFLVIYSWIFHLIFMPFAGLSGCSWGFRRLRGGKVQKKSGFSSSEPSRWREKRGRERGNERVGFHVFSSKWEAGLEGDRLCLLLICHPVNGERRGEEERAELLCTQVWEPGRALSNKLPHTWSVCPHSLSDRTTAC